MHFALPLPPFQIVDTLCDREGDDVRRFRELVREKRRDVISTLGT